MADAPEVTDIEKMPTGGGGNVNEPTSGTYGEDAALQRLLSELPTLAGQTEQAGGQPIVTAEPYEGAMAPPPGLPPALMAPSNRPEVAESTPLEQPVAPPTDPRELRILKLQQLIERGSEETREWAQTFLNALIRASNA